MKYTDMRRKKLHKNNKVYLVLLLVFGVICLTVTDGWHVYTEPLKKGVGLLGMTEIAQEEVTDPTLPSEQSEDRLGASEAGPKQEIGETESQEPDETRKSVANGGEPRFHYQTVEDDYFADAVFIGDSRTVGLYEYGELQDISTFYASTGLTVHKLFTAQIVEVPGTKQKITVEEALSERQFARIYFMIGINELGTGTVESFLEKYAESVAHMKELQPDAIIYLQGIMRVTQERSGHGDYITNEAIDIRNEGIAAMADNETIFYLDVNEAVCDENSALVSAYTFDGVHLKAQYITLWKDYLKCHAVAFD